MRKLKELLRRQHNFQGSKQSKKNIEARKKVQSLHLISTKNNWAFKRDASSIHMLISLF